LLADGSCVKCAWFRRAAQGYVRSTRAVVSTLGGEAGLAQCRTDGTSLTLRLRPGDPLAHPLVSEQRNSAGLLLRVSSSCGGAGGASAVATRVDSGYRFAGLADAQYLSAPPPKRPRLSTSGADDFADAPDALEEAGEPTPLLVVPPFFFRSDAPYDYAFRTSVAAADAAGGGPGVLGRGAPGGMAHGGAGPVAHAPSPPVTHEIDFRAAGVPGPLPAGSEWASPPEVAALLGPLFEERGVWSTAALVRRLPRDAATAARKYVASHAYRFLNGPWHRLWVRRGLDPRTDPSTRRWQCFDYRLPKEWYPQAKGKPRAGGSDAGATGGEAGAVAPGVAARGDFAAVHTLAALPARRTTFFQLCDLVHPDITALIGREPAERATCDEHCGWFRKATLDAVKAILRDAFDALAAAQGLHVEPPKPRKNVKSSKAAKAAAALADARARVSATTAIGEEGGGVAVHGAGAHDEDEEEDDDIDEEDEEEEELDLEEELAHEHDATAAAATAFAAAMGNGAGRAAQATHTASAGVGGGGGNESASDYSVFGDAD
jgi:general transcription factor 3C polypeptide 5 (transcription factor C subunit 1)